MTTSTVVFTDGACERRSSTQLVGGDVTTNQRIVRRPRGGPCVAAAVDVWSDSRYVVDCFEKSWWRKWVANGWVNSKKEAVKNRDLWEPFVELVPPATSRSSG